jgi:adenylylsulfate kinase
MSWAIWITGPPGCGKSALARAVEGQLHATGGLVCVLDLDEIRPVLTPRARHIEAELDVAYRAINYMAMHLTEAGVPVLIDAGGRRRLWRDLARTAVPSFAEVQVMGSPDVGRGASVPGADFPYEPPLAPELVIDSVSEPAAAAVARIVDLAGRVASESPPAAPPRARSWAIWITGRPGSGKTTLAERLAEALAALGIAVHVLDLPSARRLLLPDGASSELDDEIVHRAMAYTGKLLTEAGVAVIIDATAPRRAWREAARELIPCFAEVQLICPSDVCAERERAVRWHLGGESPAAAPRTISAPDLVLDYEESLRPELALRTDVHDAGTAARQVLVLVQRLRRLPTLSANSP